MTVVARALGLCNWLRSVKVAAASQFGSACQHKNSNRVGGCGSNDAAFDHKAVHVSTAY